MNDHVNRIRAELEHSTIHATENHGLAWKLVVIAEELSAENKKLKQEAALYIQGKSSKLRGMVQEYLEDAL